MKIVEVILEIIFVFLGLIAFFNFMRTVAFLVTTTREQRKKMKRKRTIKSKRPRSSIGGARPS